MVLQKDIEEKLEDKVKKYRGLKLNANEVAFHGRYDKEENEVCRTCNERIKQFITSTDIRVA